MKYANPENTVVLLDEDKAVELSLLVKLDPDFDVASVAPYIAPPEITPDYKELRKAEYASIQDQLDMIYWDQVDGTTTFKDHRAAVKAKYPKPQE